MISDIVAIDPGVRVLGWARSRGSVLVGAGCSRPRTADSTIGWAELHARALRLGSARVAVVEHMEHRRNDPRSQANDLLDVQTVGVYVAARLAPEVVMVRPSTWKGSIPKGIHHERILSVLTPEERDIATEAAREAGRHGKEALDSIGILLYHLKRINRSGGKRV